MSKHSWRGPGTRGLNFCYYVFYLNKSHPVHSPVVVRRRNSLRKQKLRRLNLTEMCLCDDVGSELEFLLQCMKLWGSFKTFSVFYLQHKVVFKGEMNSAPTDRPTDWLTAWENVAQQLNSNTPSQYCCVWPAQSHSLNSKVKRSLLYFPS
jgi:hypothetical protein